MYNYLNTWNPDDITKKITVREEDVLEQVKEIFKSISITNEKLLNEITEYLQSSNKAEAVLHRAQMEELEKEARKVENEETFWISEYDNLERHKSITKDKIGDKLDEIAKKKFELNTTREELQKADKAFKNATITAFQLLSKAYELFEGSKIEQKRRLINFVFLNLKLNGEKLEYTLRKPFDLVVNLDSHPLWRASVDEFRNNFNTFTLQDINFSKYQELFANSINCRIAA